MSDPSHPQPTPPAMETVSAATNVSWERNSSMLAKNQFAFTGPAAAPVTFSFKTASKQDFQDAIKENQANQQNQTQTTQQQQHQQIEEQIAAAALVAQHQAPTSPRLDILPPTFHSTRPEVIAPPPQLGPRDLGAPKPAQEKPQDKAPLAIGNFDGSAKWAAYHNPTTGKPYFYCHALKITTPDCPADIQSQFNPAYDQFLLDLKKQQSPPPHQPLPQPPQQHQPLPQPPILTTPALNRPPPGFIPPSHSQPPPHPTPQVTSTTPVHGSGSVPPPFGGKAPPPFLQNTPSNHSTANSTTVLTTSASHHNRNLVVAIGDETQDDDREYQSSQASQVTVNHMTTPVNRGPSFSFATDIPNPSKLPTFPPMRGSASIAETGEDYPEQHPLAMVLASNPKPFLTLPNDSGKPSPNATPTNASGASTGGYATMKSPHHLAHLGSPLLDKSIPYAELFKIDALPTQKDGTFLKLTTGFRKSWRPRYVILHQGAFRWWDDIAACSRAMTTPNAIVSIVGCSAQLPPIGSQVHPKNGLYIDGNVGAIQELLEKYDTPQDYEQASFFIRTDHLGEIDSWMHIMYRNGVVDARYVLNPDLTSKSLDAVTQSTHHLFEVWSRERVNAGPSSFQVSSNNRSGPIPPTPRNGDDVDRVSTTQIFINPADLIAAASEIATPRNNTSRGMYMTGGLYGHQPVPVPVQINNKKRSFGPYYAVLFSDRIECYENYDDAGLVCRYSNPDLNNSISPEGLSKPKLAHLIPITRESMISLEKSQVTSTYMETSLKIQVKENRWRNIKKQEWLVTFEECNPATGHSMQITNPSFIDPNKSLAEIPGTSLSIAQRWFTVLEYCLEGPLSGTFGSSLWWSITRSTIPVPLVLHNAFRFISHKGLQEEGILRVPGNNQDIVKLRRSYDSCQSDGVLTDPNTAAGLFKLFLRENSDGLVPRSMYKQFTTNNCRGAGAGASAEKRRPCVDALKVLIDQLPPLNQICLSYVIHILCKIAANANVNKMYPKNCAMVLAPNLFRAPKPPNAQGFLSNDKDANLYGSPQAMAEALAEQEAVILIMIEHVAELFPRGSPFP